MMTAIFFLAGCAVLAFSLAVAMIRRRNKREREGFGWLDDK